MDKQRIPLFETLTVIIGEIIISAIVSGVFLIIKKFALSVVFGALLGSAVTVINFLILVITANRAIDKALAERGDGELTEDEANQFAEDHKASVAAAMKISYIVRTVLLVGSLVLAFLIDGVFDPIATLIPLLAFRPLITVSQLIKKKDK